MRGCQIGEVTRQARTPGRLVLEGWGARLARLVRPARAWGGGVQGRSGHYVLGGAGWQAGKVDRRARPPGRQGQAGCHVLGRRGARQARSPGRRGQSGRHVLGGRGARQAKSPGRRGCQVGEAARRQGCQVGQAGEAR